MAQRSVRWGWLMGLVGVAASVPAVLVLESLVRAAILPPSLESLRELLNPILTPWVWRLVPAAALADVGAFLLHRRWQARAATLTSPDRRKWKQFEALMVSASLAQIPGLGAAIGCMLGADLDAVLATVAVSTLGVLALGVSLIRHGGWSEGIS